MNGDRKVNRSEVVSLDGNVRDYKGLLKCDQAYLSNITPLLLFL